MALTMSIDLPRRRAEVYLNQYWADALNRHVGIYPCHVLGLFQESEPDGYSNPVFVCELDDGHAISTGVDNVRYTDTVKGEIVE